jgi:hypothetical protein
LKDSAQLFGAASPDAHKFSIDMFNFEKRISEITPGGATIKCVFYVTDAAAKRLSA